MEGRTIKGRWRVQSLEARARSGPLYLAEDTEGRGTAALKLFAASPAWDSEEMLRYRRALEALPSGVDGVLRPLETDRFEGRCFQVLPHVAAPNLGAWLGGTPLKAAQAAPLLLTLARSLAALHAALPGQALWHGRLTPANVLMRPTDRGVLPLLTDPARHLLESAGAVTAQEAAFLAPEQMPGHGEPADARADQYGLGMLAVVVLTGEAPFRAGTLAQVFHQHWSQPLPPLRAGGQAIEPELAALVRRLCAKQPWQRFPNMASAAQALADWTARHEPAEPSVTVRAEAQAAPPGSQRPGLPSVGGVGDPPVAADALATALAQTTAGHGVLLLLEGPALGGLESLYRSAAPLLRGTQALVLRAPPALNGWMGAWDLPLRLLEDLLGQWETLPDLQRRDLLHRLEGSLGDNAALLQGLLPALDALLPQVREPAPLPLPRRRPRLLHALCAAFGALGQPGRPLVLWLGGLEGWDAESLDWLRQMTLRLADWPVVLVAAGAPGVAQQAGWPEASLIRCEAPPLRPAQTEALLRTALGLPAPGPAEADLPAAPGPDLAHTVATRLQAVLETGAGTARTTVELALHALVARGALEPRGAYAPQAPAALDLPPWREEPQNWPPDAAFATPADLAALLLDTLPDRTLTVLEAAAVCAAPFGFEALAHLLDHYPRAVLLEELEQAALAGVLRQWGEGWVFRDGALRQVLLRAQDGERRQHYHLLAATDPATPQAPLRHALQEARHLEAGGDAARALAAALDAHALAWHHAAYHAVSALTDRLHSALGQEEQGPDLLLHGARAALLLGQAPRAEALLLEAEALSLSAAERAQVALWSAYAAAAQGRGDAIAPRIAEALQHAGEALPSHPVGSLFARLGEGAARRYGELRAAVGADRDAGDGERSALLADLWEGAALLLADAAPQQAELADEKLLRLLAGQAREPALLRALVRIGARTGQAEGPALGEARQLAAQQALPFEEGLAWLATGRCHLGAFALHPARQALGRAAALFAGLGMAQEEADAQLALLDLARLQGPCEGLQVHAARLEQLACQSEDGALHSLATAHRLHALALTGAEGLVQLTPRLRQMPRNLLKQGHCAFAARSLALLLDAQLLGARFADLVDTLHTAAELFPAALTEQPAALLPVLAEAHALQAVELPAERAHHLAQAREAVKQMRRARPDALGTLRAEVLEQMAQAAAGTLDLPATQALLDRLEGQGARLLAARLRHRVTGALHRAQHTDAMAWTGRLLTSAGQLGCAPLAAAARTLSGTTLPAEEADGADADGSAVAPGSGVSTAAGDTAARWDGTLSEILARMGTQGALPEAELLAALARVLAQSVAADAVALYLPDGTGGLSLRSAHPAQQPPPPNRHLVEAVWQRGQGQLLESYQTPQSGGGPAITFPDLHALAAVPLLPPGAGSAAGAVALASISHTRGRWQPADLARLEAAARQAALALGLNRTLAQAGEGRAALTAAQQRQQAQMQWAAQAGFATEPAALLQTWFAHCAVPRGLQGAALLFQEPDGRWRLAAVEVRSGVAPELAALRREAFSAEGGWLAALTGQGRPLRLNAEALLAPPPQEQALLEALLATDGLWLPLLDARRLFGAVLLATDGLPVSLPEWQEAELERPLRLLTPALRHARDLQALRAEQGLLKARLHEAEEERHTLRQWVPPLLAAYGTHPAGAGSALLDGVQLPVVAGAVGGLGLVARQGSGALLESLQHYLQTLQAGLGLHEGHFDRWLEQHWLAHYEASPSSAVWGLLTLHQQLREVADRQSRLRLPQLPTGLGLALGPVIAGALDAGPRKEPVILGEGTRSALRLATAAQRLGTGVLLGGNVAEALEGDLRMELRPLGELGGEAGEPRIPAYELLAARPEAEQALLKDLRAVWEGALTAYRGGDLQAAEAGFARVLAELREDRPARWFLRQCRLRASGVGSPLAAPGEPPPDGDGPLR